MFPRIKIRKTGKGCIRFMLPVLLSFLVGNQPNLASTGQLKIENYSYKDGIATSGINSVYRDSMGFLWLCSNNGVLRFDGYGFRNINAFTKGHLKIGTFCITETSDHNFFFGTDSGLVYYNARSGQIFPLKLSMAGKFQVYRIILRDTRIWAATNSGLMVINLPEKVDPGTVFSTAIHLPDSLHRRTSQDNIVNTMHYSQESNSLWVGTNGALYEMDPQTMRFTYISSGFQNSIRDISSWNNHLLVSSWDGGVFVVDPLKHAVEENEFIAGVNQIVGDKRVMSAFVDQNQRIWIATFGNGLYVFNPGTKVQTGYVNYRNDQREKESIGFDFIRKMYVDNSGIIWLNTDQPILTKIYYEHSDVNFFQPAPPPTGSVKEFLAISAANYPNQVWVATNGGGIYLFNAINGTFTQFTDHSGSGLRLQHNEIVLTYQDRLGNLWIVYRRFGLFVVPARSMEKLLKEPSAGIIIPTDANHLAGGNPAMNSYITSFFEDTRDRLWVGSWGGLDLIPLQTNFSDPQVLRTPEVYKLGNRVYSDAGREKVNFPVAPVMSIAQISDSTYWLGTFGAGVIQITEDKTNRFSGCQLDIHRRLQTNNINAIRKVNERTVWIGTNAGLCEYDLFTGHLRMITSEDGLSSENINCIVEDLNGRIWASTSFGISSVQPGNGLVQNYLSGNNDNLNQYIPNAGLRVANGSICFSTIGSLAVIFPDSAATDKKEIPLYFTDLKIDNKTILPFEKVKGTMVINTDINHCSRVNVPYNHGLSIEFAALDFKHAGTRNYKYRLGKDKEWILLGINQRSISIPNLKHGEYVLEVALANVDYQMSSRKLVIRFLPPFWQSAAAYAVYVILLILAIYFSRRLLIQKIRQQSLIDKARFEKRKLEELDKMRTEFISNVSHEFRTPLSLIINPLENLLKEEEVSEGNKNKIKLILKSSNRLLKLTNELMDLSKIEQQLLRPEFRMVEMVNFVNEVCNHFNNLSESMHFDFKINSSVDHIELAVDRGMIEKVLFNLLSNAFKYTPANGMILVNMSRCNLLNDEFFKISVINSGEGIASENLDRIFDRYYQVSNLQNKKVEGTGIGLAIVKSFVDLHHGKVEVKSERNLETCFDVYLPLRQKGFIQETEEGTSESGDSLNAGIIAKEPLTSDPQDEHAIRLLIVEDDDDVRDYLVKELTNSYEVLSAREGNEGLETAGRVIPDLIITDVMMPGMSGLELCRSLKNQVLTSHIPILILSARAGVDKQIEGLEMGADVYLVKPFHIDHLRAQISRLLRLKESIHSAYLKETSLTPTGAVSNQLDEEFLNKVNRFVEGNLTNADLNVEQLAACVSLSKVQTYRKIKAISGLSIVEYIRTIRLKKAAQMIREGKHSISEIAFETGFSSPSYFSKCFHDHFGKTPSEFAE